ncbi:hypothetical protein FISHEDRAFT_56161 [Fistulina hepatica ATCC 64428]|uniref:Uncharacterized protein n=1 Tax=Fistulina hepatica ATCC 64428 TaxID=1128425 RepID=A0A0D7ALL9_9AGAR|nr:hypothetical protein FISHEDRAFT_56161 [Fistulina hepatica ATCC 64428]
MNNGEQQHSPFVADPRVLVAATIVLAGSAAYLWRSNVPSDFVRTSFGSSTAAGAVATRGTDPGNGSHGNAGAKSIKGPRSKERRRRGKDPMKELLKNGRKSKGLQRLSRVEDDTPLPFPATLEQGQQQQPKRARDVSCSSSRSMASGHTFADSKSSHGCTDDEDGIFSSVSATTASTCATEISVNTSNGDTKVDVDETANDTTRVSQSVSSTFVSTSDSQSGAFSGMLSECQSDTSTSLPSSISDSTPTPSSFKASPQLLPLDPASPGSAHRPRSRGDGDGAPPTSASDTVYQTLPRLASTSRIPAHRTEKGGHTNAMSPSSTAASTSASPRPRDVVLNESSISCSGSSSRQVSSSRRATTPSSGTSTPPTVAVQTQIASLRGALEAARMREEKCKADNEVYAKELESLRWENAHWRRREVELQTQIHQLIHQVHSYGALFASMSAQTHVANGGSAASSNADAGPSAPYPVSCPPSSQPQSPVVHPMSQMISPFTMTPPFFPIPSPQGGYFPYPPFQSSPYMPPPPKQTPTQSQAAGHHPLSVLTMFGPPSNCSGKDASESGSVSPEKASPTSGNRGRPRARIDHGNTNNFAEDGDHGRQTDDTEISDLLTDAIFKRPESIRASSRKDESKHPGKGTAAIVEPLLIPVMSTPDSDSGDFVGDSTSPGVETDDEPTVAFKFPSLADTPANDVVTSPMVNERTDL